MQTPSIDARAVREAGLAALQAGDASNARRHFEALIAAGQADASIWMALAMSCQGLGDQPAMVAALDRVLAINPHDLRALIMKGDHLAVAGDTRAASSFYGAVIALASQITNLPAWLARAVSRVTAARARIVADMEAHLCERLAASGYDEKTSSKRFTQSLALLSGKKQPYFQRPRAYFFPELPQIQFYPRPAFPWLDAIEAASEDICAELTEVLRRDNAFVPYIQASADEPGREHKLLNSSDWSAFFLWKDGEVVPDNAACCPKTLAALAGAPLARIKGRAPSILFSLLKPGVRIAPHTGFLNARLICHLPLIVPPGCRFRVGNDEREWQHGKAWVFDDTIEHEAWNSSDRTRVVLIFDIWRPELTDEERGLVAALMEAVDTYSGTPAPWDS